MSAFSTNIDGRLIQSTQIGSAKRLASELTRMAEYHGRLGTWSNRRSHTEAIFVNAVYYASQANVDWLIRNGDRRGPSDAQAGSFGRPPRGRRLHNVPLRAPDPEGYVSVVDVLVESGAHSLFEHLNGGGLAALLSSVRRHSDHDGPGVPGHVGGMVMTGVIAALGVASWITFLSASNQWAWAGSWRAVFFTAAELSALVGAVVIVAVAVLVIGLIAFLHRMATTTKEERQADRENRKRYRAWKKEKRREAREQRRQDGDPDGNGLIWLGPIFTLPEKVYHFTDEELVHLLEIFHLEGPQSIMRVYQTHLRGFVAQMVLQAPTFTSASWRRNRW